MEEFNLSAIIRFFELGVTSAFGIYLVEYGYPIDAIRLIEARFTELGTMNLEESISFLGKNMHVIIRLLDTCEIELLTTALTN